MAGMMPTPPAAPGGAPGGPAPSPQGPQGAGAPGAKPQQAPMSAQQSLVMIHTGFENLGKLLAGAPPNVLSPQDKQLFNDAVNSFQAMVQHLGQGQSKQPGAMPQGNAMAARTAAPIPQHANSGAKATY